MTIIFGLFEFDGKRHTVNKVGESKYVVKFKDEHGNKLTVACGENDFETYAEGSTFDWNAIRRQSTLPQE